jgi:hypothetical protein
MSPEMRIGDTEREAAVSALGEHYLAGRLSKEEYDERTGVAWTARTASELRPLFADLPATRPQAAAPSAPSPSRPRQRGRGFGVPVLPILLIVIAILVVAHVPWWGWLILVWLWLSGAFGIRRRVGERSHRHR